MLFRSNKFSKDASQKIGDLKILFSKQINKIKSENTKFPPYLSQMADKKCKDSIDVNLNKITEANDKMDSIIKHFEAHLSSN